MKILYAWNLYREHGGENQWYPSEPALMRAGGHDTLLYERDNRELDGFGPLQKARLFFEATWSRRTYREVRELCRRERPDVAHVYNTVVLLSPSIFHALHDEGVPVVQTLYNYRMVCPAATLLRNGKVCEECIDHSLWRSVRHRCYRGSALQSAALARSISFHRRAGTWNRAVSAFIVPTPFMKAKLASGGVDPDRIRVKPNWHEPDPGGRDGPPSDFCLYVGRLSEEKGIRTVVHAWRHTPGLPPLRIIGDGPLRAEVEQGVGASPSSPIEYLGRRPHDEVMAAMKAARAFLLPSEWYEAFPHTILEAYGCGVPIVASRLGTMPDVIEEGVTGLLYPPGNSQALAETVLRLWREPGLVEQLGRQARTAFVEKYSAASAYRNLLAIYEEVIRAH